MPRRRSRLNVRAANAALALLPIGCAIIAAGCPAASRDNGCQIRRQLVLPDTATLSLSDVQLERAGSGYVILGSDGAAVRWTTVDASGVFGTEQAFPLPDGTLRAYYGLAGVDSPGDRVVIGLLTTAING